MHLWLILLILILNGLVEIHLRFRPAMTYQSNGFSIDLVIHVQIHDDLLCFSELRLILHLHEGPIIVLKRAELVIASLCCSPHDLKLFIIN